MAVANVKSEWISGNLVFKDKATGTEIFRISSSTTGLKLTQLLNLIDDIGLVFGTGSDVTVDFDSTREALVTEPLGNYIAPEGMSDRYTLKWFGGQRGKPGLNADILNATEATRMVTDPHFEILGTNASSDDVTYYAEGGITFTTDGADGDGVILLPHLDANQSAWTQVTWGSDKETRWECDITTGASIDNCIIWCGLKLTNTDVIATDADSVFFRYENGVNSGKFQTNYSIGGTDTTADSGVTAAINTRYHFVINIDSSRVATMYINGALITTSTALTDAKDFIPYIGVEADGAAEAKTLHIHSQAISRTIG